MSLAVSGSQALWYTTRATGIVAFVLLTLTVAFGILTTVRYQSEAWPRFAMSYLHRRISLVTMVFLGIHVISTVLDSFAPIGWLSVVVPFTSPYRRLWLSFGTIALDLLLAVTISSMLRQRIDARSWRLIHWLSYASWPVAILHAFGTGTDPRLHWVLGVTVACILTVAAAGAVRLASGWPIYAGRRIAIGSAAVAGVVAAGVWAAAGPLQPGWAAKAGTPASLLGHSAAAAGATSGATSPPSSGTGSSAATGSSSSNSSSSTSSSGTSSAALPAPPYQAQFTGTLTQKPTGNGLVEVDLSGQSNTSPEIVFTVALVGTPDGSGGVVMQQGSGTLGTRNAPSTLSGQVVGLSGTRIVLGMHDAAGNPQSLSLRIEISGNSIAGQLVVRSGAPSSGEGGGE
ncbi:MAG TPA: ferric reductase-like transmembrane domain-containing protein [Acidimicrobiales bacterium]|nr:ferric reductase-like transmembrane domain-containing protein [Acidimicrobiales bacterium]